MAAPCPTCGKDFDPLRAPAARVVGGKIVAYCSAGCADQLPRAAAAVALPVPVSAAAAAKPTRAVTAPSPAPAVAVDADELTAVAVARPPRRRRLVLGLTAGIVVGGMAVAIVQAVSPSSPARVEAGQPAIDAGVVDATPARD